MPFSLLSDVLASLKETTEAAAACRNLLSQPKAPPTLINWFSASAPRPPLAPAAAERTAEPRDRSG
jgi:hypothetical protein